MLKTILVLLTFSLFTEGRCQKTNVRVLDSISKSIAENLDTHDGEQAYLTTNKSIYTPGENVWFRAFLLRSVSNKVSAGSKTLFVDVVDKDDKRLNIALLSAKDQRTTGTLSLPDSLPSGNYWLRAYTRSMANSEAEKASIVPIYFFNPQLPDPVPNEKDSRTTKSPPVVHFYAEGGTLAPRASSAIALHIADNNGRPIQINGQLKDSLYGALAEFHTNAQGLSKITFSPRRYRKYWVEIKWKDSTIRYDLPAFNFYAGQLAVSRNSDRDFVVRTTLEDSLYSKDAVTYLIGISRGKVCFAASGSGRYELEIPEQNFPKGIATFLLFDAARQLLSERTVYVKTGNFNFRLNLIGSGYSKREKVSLNTTVLDDKAKPLLSSLTISVADNSSMSLRANNNHHLVNSILSGHEDNWSVAHLTGLTDDEVDLVMLCVQDRFKRLAAAKPIAAPEETDSLLYIKGALSNNQKTVPNKIITLFTTIPFNVLMTDTTDAAGRFSFPLEAYADSTRFALQVGNASAWEKGLKLSVDSLPLPEFRTPYTLKSPLDIDLPEVRSYFFHYADTSLRIAKKELLKEVFVKSSKLPFEKKRVSIMSKIITSDALIERGRATLGDALLGSTEVNIMSSGKYPILIIDGNVFPFDNGAQFLPKPDRAAVSAAQNGGNRPGGGAGGSSGSDVLESLDFSPVYYFLNRLIIKDIDFIEILSPFAALEYGPRGQYGGIYIHTKAADGVYEDGGLRMFLARGYSQEPDFPSVNYESKAARNDQETDRRSTLLWAGSVLNNAAGNCNEEFYTNDIPGAYTVTVSGITQHGDIILDTQTFKVK